MIEGSGRKSFAPELEERLAAEGGDDPGPRRNFAAPLTWLNLACLDAPLVAVSWQWLFASSLDLTVTGAVAAALFLTAWLIYLADRFSDACRVAHDAPLSLRQQFCRRHRVLWIIALVLIGTVDLWIVGTRLSGETLLWGITVGIGAAVYLFVNQAFASAWRVAPMKELSIGFLFALGAIVPLARAMDTLGWFSWFLFACLCSLNCIAIALWERQIDLAQRRISFATVFPAFGGSWLVMVAMIGLAAVAAFTQSDRRALFGCIAVSAGLLAVVQVYRDRLPGDVRTALADLVLLTPIAVWVKSILQ